MLTRFLKNRGQTVTGQYVLVFFIAIATITSMTIYFRRAIQGRIRDARDYTVRMINEGGTGVSVLAAYEPYYVNRSADRMLDQDDSVDLRAGTYTQSGRQRTVTNTTTNQGLQD